MHAFFLFDEKKISLFSRYLDFCVFEKSKTSKSMTSAQALLPIRSYIFDYSFKIPGSIKMKFDHILAQVITKISNLCLTFEE